MAEAVAASSSRSHTVTVYAQREPQPALVLHSEPVAERPPQISWETGTIDNEHLNKKKSKCCCIYEKPRTFGDSSSDSEDSDCGGGGGGDGKKHHPGAKSGENKGCTDNCCGHKNKCYRKMPEGDQ